MREFQVQIQGKKRERRRATSKLVDYLRVNGLKPVVTEERGSANVGFLTTNRSVSWRLLKRYVESNRHFQEHSIILCQGRRGWGDYMVLHHFEPCSYFWSRSPVANPVW